MTQTRTRHRVGTFDAFRPGTITVVEVDGKSIGIANSGTELYAVLNVCPHQLAPLCQGVLRGRTESSRPGEITWDPENRVIRCPWHGYEFDLSDDGRPVCPGVSGKARTYPVSIDGGDVFVELKQALVTTAT